MEARPPAVPRQIDRSTFRYGHPAGISFLDEKPNFVYIYPSQPTRSGPCTNRVHTRGQHQTPSPGRPVTAHSAQPLTCARTAHISDRIEHTIDIHISIDKRPAHPRPRLAHLRGPAPTVAGSQIPPWAMRSVTARTPCLVCTNAHIRSTLNINSTRAADIFICTPPSLPDTLLCTIKQGQRHPGTIQIYIRDICPCLRTSMQDVHPFVFVASTARGDGTGSRHRADARISASVHHHVQTPHECLISLMFIRQITKA